MNYRNELENKLSLSHKHVGYLKRVANFANCSFHLSSEVELLDNLEFTLISAGLAGEIHAPHTCWPNDTIVPKLVKPY